MKSSESNRVINELMEERLVSKSDLSERLGLSLGVVCNALNRDDSRLDGVRVKILRYFGLNCEIRKEIYII